MVRAWLGILRRKTERLRPYSVSAELSKSGVFWQDGQWLSITPSAPQHECWRSETCKVDETVFDDSRIQGSRQVTDVRLPGLAHLGQV